MINLIPPDARHYVTIEYWVRAATVWLFLTAIALLTVTVFLVPVYVLVHGQLVVADAAVSSATQPSFTTLEHEITTTNEIAKQLATINNTPVFSQYLDTVDRLTPVGVTITSISMERPTSTIRQIIVSGTAASRLSLAAYRDALQADPAFTSAALPLSNLAKDKNIPFTITVATVTSS